MPSALFSGMTAQQVTRHITHRTAAVTLSALFLLVPGQIVQPAPLPSRSRAGANFLSVCLDRYHCAGGYAFYKAIAGNAPVLHLLRILLREAFRLIFIVAPKK